MMVDIRKRKNVITVRHFFNYQVSITKARGHQSVLQMASVVVGRSTADSSCLVSWPKNQNDIVHEYCCSCGGLTCLVILLSFTAMSPPELPIPITTAFLLRHSSGAL